MSEIELSEFGDKEVNLAVCVTNGYKYYGTKMNMQPVLKEVDMNVSKGTIYGLLGASGCGKTTLLSCLIGLKSLNSGDVWILGSTPEKKNAKRIGYMPQQLSLCNEFTIRESMKFFGWLAGLSTEVVEKRLEFVTKLLVLPDVNNKIEHLSGGQQRRVSFAMALLHEPELLILDEPTVGLDPLLREAIWEHLLNLTKTKATTIILTTHYIDEAREADKIGLMHNGVIICEETPENLLVKFDSDTLEEVFYKAIVRNTKPNKRLRIPQIQDVTKNKTTINTNNILTLLWKNFKWMWRNYVFIISVCLLPILTVYIFGLATSGNPKNLRVGLFNQEVEDSNCDVLMCNSSYLSCHFLRYLEGDTITLIPLHSKEEAELSVNRGKTLASLIIKSNYTQALKERIDNVLLLSDSKFEASTIDIIYDTSLIDIAYFMKVYFYKRLHKFLEDYMEACGIPKKVVAPPVKVFSPVYGIGELWFTDSISPGILLSLAFFLSMALTAGVTMIERNEGILERFLVMGVNMLEVLIAHFISLFGIVVLQCICPLLLLVFFFNITMKGSMILVTCFTLMAGVSGLCAGFTISCWSSNKTHALYYIAGSYLATIFALGVLWPLEGMNYYLRFIVYCLPLTIPMESLRNVLQRGWNLYNSSVFIGLIIINSWTVIFLILGFIGLKPFKK